MENSISCNKSEIDQNVLRDVYNPQGSRKQVFVRAKAGLWLQLFAVKWRYASEPPKAKTKRRHRSGSYLRREARRRAAFLERKKKHPLEEEVTTTRQGNNVCGRVRRCSEQEHRIFHADIHKGGRDSGRGSPAEFESKTTLPRRISC